LFSGTQKNCSFLGSFTWLLVLEMKIIIPHTANVWIGFVSVILEGEVFANTAAGDFIPHVVTVYTGEVMQKPVCVVVFLQIYVMMHHLALVLLSNFDRSFLVWRFG